MARTYIHELRAWPAFAWDSKALALLLSEVRLRQGLLVGKMRGYGLASQWTATLRSSNGRDNQIERHRGRGARPRKRPVLARSAAGAGGRRAHSAQGSKRRWRC